LSGTLYSFPTLDEYHNKIHDHHDVDEISDDDEMNMESELVKVSPASMNRLGKIITDLRKKVPVSAEAPGEEITIPKTEEASESINDKSWKPLY
jgi:hypothetical protein